MSCQSNNIFRDKEVEIEGFNDCSPKYSQVKVEWNISLYNTYLIWYNLVRFVRE